MTPSDRTRDQLRGLRKKETELIDAKKQTLEKQLFGLSTVTSSDPGQVLLYRDAQDRAARLTQSDEAAQVFAAALRSDDKILAAAVLGRALDAGWNSIIDEYVNHNPSAGEDLRDLAELGGTNRSKPPSPMPGAHNRPNARDVNTTHRPNNQFS